MTETTYDVQFRRPITVASVPQMSNWRDDQCDLTRDQAIYDLQECRDRAKHTGSGTEFRIVKKTREVLDL